MKLYLQQKVEYYYEVNMREKEIEKHMNMFFTDEGFDILHKYTQSLVKEWHSKKESEYPFRLGLVIGIAYFNDTAEDRTFYNKSELEGRIKGYMQLMCLKNISVDMGHDAKLIFELGGEK